jgi:hypothetical protein
MQRGTFLDDLVKERLGADFALVGFGFISHDGLASLELYVIDKREGEATRTAVERHGDPVPVWKYEIAPWEQGLDDLIAATFRHVHLVARDDTVLGSRDASLLLDH